MAQFWTEIGGVGRKNAGFKHGNPQNVKMLGKLPSGLYFPAGTKLGVVCTRKVPVTKAIHYNGGMPVDMTSDRHTSAEADGFLVYWHSAVAALMVLMALVVPAGAAQERAEPAPKPSVNKKTGATWQRGVYELTVPYSVPRSERMHPFMDDSTSRSEHRLAAMMRRRALRESMLGKESRTVTSTDPEEAEKEVEYAPNMVVVQFTPEVALAHKAGASGLQEFDRRASRHEIYLLERVFPFLDHVAPTPRTRRNVLALRRTYYARYRAGTAPKTVANELKTAPGVVYAEPVLVNRTQAMDAWERIDPNDPEFSQQPELNLMRLPEAWDLVKSGNASERVVIAIVDGGGEWRHEDLRANVWTNPNEIAGNGIDDDGNGFTDDVHGVNFANEDDMNNDPTGLPETPGAAQHGTATAGSASAVTDNNVGIAGAAWNADLMHINAGCGGDEFICYGYEGILYAAANGADIINASWGGLAGSDDDIRLPDQTLNLATDMGALVVAAAGNDDQSNDLFRSYPARNPRVLSVGATEKDSRRRAGFSNYGKLVNVFAPGVDIRTTGSNNGYVFLSGTSFASPLTAGMAALVKTRFPDMSPDALREHIRLTSDNIDAENPGTAGRMGRGFVNALAAVQMPSLPAVRLLNWSWTDDDGDGQAASGDVVTVMATVVNYLADAGQLGVALVAAEEYSFLDLSAAEANVGYLASGDSAEVTFEFTLASDAPVNQRVSLFLRSRDGAHEDQADQITFRVNRSLESVHRNLSALYTATGGDQWTNNDNWDVTRVPSEEELAEWFGVGLYEGWLTSLALSANNLTGPLPSELGDLTELQSLVLEANSLTGPIPPELGDLTELRELWLGSNSLSGTIPPELGDLTELRELWLQSNSLTGPIPPELGDLAELQWLVLEANSLTGPIPPELGDLAELIDLLLSGNSLTGPIPPELGNLNGLKGLSLAKNLLSGRIPPEFGKLLELSWVEMWGNSLSGPIPPEIGNLAKLEWLDLSNNDLSGPIPPEIGNLVEFEYLVLSANSLTGPIPPELGYLTELQWMELSANSLTGPIPPELGDLTKLQWLGLSANSLTGPIPPELGDLAELQWLLLSGNSLTGPIPPQLGDLTRLQLLELDANSLTGVLPRSLMQLDSLESFYFGGQELCAPRDDEFQAWLNRIPDVSGPTCVGLRLQFTDTIADQNYPRAQPIAPLALPEATGGVSPVSYSLAPVLPVGLSFDSSTRTISGTPTEVTEAPVTFTYNATDAAGDEARLHFDIKVYLPVATEQQTLPESFALRSNYPNPFRQTTQIVFDLPSPARVSVEVIDMVGRRVMMLSPDDKSAGWERHIALDARSLPPGHYVYRLIMTSSTGNATQSGHFVRFR